MGPHGPEVLSYDLVRTVMRDDRFAMPKGVFLAAQGITSGELWDISLKGLLSLDGAEHHRQRRLVSKAFTPRAAERLRTTCTESLPNSSTTTPAQAGATWSPTSRGDTPSPSSAPCSAPHQETGTCSPTGPTTSSKSSSGTSSTTNPTSCAHGTHSRTISIDMVTRRRDALGDDLLSDMIRAEVEGDRLTHDELLTLAATLLMAGTDTTRNQLAACGTGLLRTSRSVGATRRASRAGPQGRRGGDALLSRHLHRTARRC